MFSDSMRHEYGSGEREELRSHILARQLAKAERERDEAREAARHIFDLLSTPLEGQPTNMFMRLTDRWPWLEEE